MSQLLLDFFQALVSSVELSGHLGKTLPCQFDFLERSLLRDLLIPEAEKLRILTLVGSTRRI